MVAELNERALSELGTTALRRAQGYQCLIKALQEAIHGRWDRSREVELLGDSKVQPKAEKLPEHSC